MCVCDNSAKNADKSAAYLCKNCICRKNDLKCGTLKNSLNM